MTAPGARPRIYAAHPITVYGTDHERACLDTLAARFPGAEVFNPAGRYRTSAGWLRAWPRVVRTLSALVVFGDEDGVVGIGCVHEVADAVLLGVPVAVLDEDHHLCELEGLIMLPAADRSPWRTAWVLCGDPLAVLGQMPSDGSESMIATLSSDTRTMRAKRSTM